MSAVRPGTRQIPFWAGQICTVAIEPAQFRRAMEVRVPRCPPAVKGRREGRACRQSQGTCGIGNCSCLRAWQLNRSSEPGSGTIHWTVGIRIPTSGPATGAKSNSSARRRTKPLNNPSPSPGNRNNPSRPIGSQGTANWKSKDPGLEGVPGQALRRFQQFWNPAAITCLACNTELELSAPSLTCCSLRA